MKIARQGSLFGADESQEEGQYTNKIKAPIYEPTGKKPHILELVDITKTKQLIREIAHTNLPQDEKEFLIEAARRHSVFHYEKIAEYYAHSNKEVQELMEKSALVIIDFGKAIELGYVRLCEEIKNQYLGAEDE
jgi:hypothetical protein